MGSLVLRGNIETTLFAKHKWRTKAKIIQSEFMSSPQDFKPTHKTSTLKCVYVLWCQCPIQVNSTFYWSISKNFCVCGLNLLIFATLEIKTKKNTKYLLIILHKNNKNLLNINTNKILLMKILSKTKNLLEEWHGLTFLWFIF